MIHRLIFRQSLWSIADVWPAETELAPCSTVVSMEETVLDGF